MSNPNTVQNATVSRKPKNNEYKFMLYGSTLDSRDGGYCGGGAFAANSMKEAIEKCKLEHCSRPEGGYTYSIAEVCTPNQKRYFTNIHLKIECQQNGKVFESWEEACNSDIPPKMIGGQWVH